MIRSRRPHVDCDSCVFGWIREWQQDGSGRWRHGKVRCRKCLGTGRMPPGRLEPGLVAFHRPWPHSMEELVTEQNTDLAIVDTVITIDAIKSLMGSPSMPERYRESQSGVKDAVAAILAGRELGLAPMASIMNLYVVNGGVAMMGKAMTAKILAAGHIFKVTKTATKATVKCWRWHDQTGELIEVGSTEFTMEMAKKAGLTSKDNWKKYPTIMLAWRAVSEAARLYYSDCIMGFGYVPEEIGADIVEVEDIPDEVVEAEIVEVDDGSSADASG